MVKEVERLKENREKRRAQQAQILEEQETLRNKDPGNPNWEFQQMILDYKDQLDFNPLQDGDPIANHQITVCIRKRPLASKEIKKKEVDVVTVPSKDQLTIHEPKSKVDLTKYLDNQNFRLVGRHVVSTKVLEQFWFESRRLCFAAVFSCANED